MLVREYKILAKPQQLAAIDQAIRTTQFLRNKGIAYWQANRDVQNKHLQRLSSILAKEYSWVAKLNSQARQVALDRSWAAISRFYDNCQKQKP